MALFKLFFLQRAVMVQYKTLMNLVKIIEDLIVFFMVKVGTKLQEQPNLSNIENVHYVESFVCGVKFNTLKWTYYAFKFFPFTSKLFSYSL